MNEFEMNNRNTFKISSKIFFDILSYVWTNIQETINFNNRKRLVYPSKSIVNKVVFLLARSK